jgi:general secretion pathway protein C
MTDLPSLLRNAAMASTALGAGLWAATILAPSPSALPPLLHLEMPSVHDTKSVARWFGGGSARVRVNVNGIISSRNGEGAALLSVNGAPVQAYRTGQLLAPGISLRGVAQDAVVIDQDGISERVQAATLADGVIAGFEPVAPRLSTR